MEHLTETEQRILRVIRAHDPRPWPSARRLAREAGCSIRTVRRFNAKLRAEGAVENRWRRNGSQASNVYRLPAERIEAVQQRQRERRVTPRRSNPSRTYRTLAYARVRPIGEERLHVNDLARGGSPPTTRDILAATVDSMALHGIPVTRRAKGMLARQTKELLDDGFDADVLLTASVIALRRGAPGHMHYIAQDIAVARAGQRISRRQYEEHLTAAAKLLDPDVSEQRERLLRILGDGS